MKLRPSDALDVRDERLWKGEQSLYGSLIGYYGSILVRATIRRDHYDNQCNATVDAWGQEGWTQVQYVPIQELGIFNCSPYGNGAWQPQMRASLLELCQLARRILVP